jgi:NAD(P)-dependent dehydrogenase (short-subunit alcohol dehydrogenase family)
MGKLDGKIAIVTGASMGIGRATARRFIEEGAEVVVIVGRTTDSVRATAEALGPRCHAMGADLSDVKQVTRMIEEVARTFARIDVLFLNHAAIAAEFEVMEDMTEELFDRVTDTNLKGNYFAIKAARKYMPPGSAIIMTASIGAHIPSRFVHVFNMSKAGIVSLTHSLCAVLAPQRIRINSVSPGFIDSGVFQKIGMSDGDLTALKSTMSKWIPTGRIATVDEIANGVVFLACEDSSYVNGTDLCIDGGLIQVMPIYV